MSESTRPAYTEAEMDQAVSLLMEALEPAAERLNLNPAQVMDRMADDLLNALVTAYLIAVKKQTAPERIRSEAAVLATGLLKRTPGREDLAEQLIRTLYRTIRTEHGLPTN
jgi:hypothetical protein